MKFFPAKDIKVTFVCWSNDFIYYELGNGKDFIFIGNKKQYLKELKNHPFLKKICKTDTNSTQSKCESIMITKYIETKDFVQFELEDGQLVIMGQDLIKAIQNHPKIKELYEKQYKEEKIS